MHRIFNIECFFSSLDVNHYLDIGVNMRWFSSLVAIEKRVRSTVPVKFVTHVDPVTHSLSVKYFTPKEVSCSGHVFLRYFIFKIYCI